MGTYRYALPLGIGLVAGAGILLVFIATPTGVGVMPDSIIYLVGAGNIASGNGFIAFNGSLGSLRPVTHYPPLFSALVASISYLGMTVESAARVLNAALLGANAVLAVIAVRCLAPAAGLSLLLAGGLVVSGPDILAGHTLAMTEPLFIAFSLVATICLIRYSARPTLSALAGAGLATAAAALTRYAGGALMMGSVCVILALSGRKLTSRIKDAAIFGAIAFLPSGLWAVRNRLVNGGASDRAIGFHPLGSEQWISGASTVSKWSLTGRMEGATGVALGALGLVILIAFFWYVAPRRKIANGDSDLVIPILIGSYWLFLIFTAFVVDADTVMDSRSFVPVHFWMIVLAVAWASRKLVVVTRPSRIIAMSLACLLLVSYSLRSSMWLLDVRRDGQMYTSQAWRGSPTIDDVRRMAHGATVFSNGSDAIYYLTRRSTLDLPAKFDPHTTRAAADLDRKFDDIKLQLAEHGGYVVYFNALSWKTFFPSEDELRSRLGLRLVASEPDGNIYTMETK